jgi:hypothetical protein
MCHALKAQYGRLSEAEFLCEIQTKALRVFLLAIHSRLYSFALIFYFFKITQPLVKLKEKGRKPDRKPYPLFYGLRNPYKKTSSLRLLKIIPRNLNEILHS